MRRSRLIGADAEPRSTPHSRKRLKKGKAFSYEPSRRSSIVCNFILYPIYFSVKTFIYFCDLRHFLTCVFVHFANRAKNMTYDLICISKAYSMTFRKNRRYPTTPGGTACGRAGLQYVRKQAAVYAGLRCVRRQCAQAGGCICRLAAGASSRHHRPSPAEIAAAEFAGLCARANWGAVCRRTYTQIPKAGEASRRRRATVRRRAYTQMPPSVHAAAGEALCRLTACEIRCYRCRRRAFRRLAEVLKEALCRRPVYTNGRYPWQANRCAGRRRAKIDAIGHQRRCFGQNCAFASGRATAYAGCVRANGYRPRCATAADEPPRRSTGV